MTPAEVRESYLAFFEARGHTRHPSDSLVPQNDPTLLFTGAGMNQFKAEFLGKGTLPFTRATTAQKCLRMPDLENVGRTASHHTFFEMLGNFSFGDYFKADAIRWAWELLMSWGVPGDRLSVTVYTDDDEAAALWSDEVGVPAEHVFRYGEEDNFWPASAPSKGPNGLCGPCSEIYFDFHPERGPIPPEGPAEDGARFAEIWNLVFTQFERRDGGELVPLPSKNIDTGMGFERMVRVLETLERGEVLASNFETSLFAPILEHIHAHVGRATEHGTPDGERVRRVADHVRAAAFCIGDGVRPSNLKQGYVVRKVLRRAMLDRHVLGGNLKTSYLAELAGLVVDLFGDAYPDLREARGLVTSTVENEEARFADVMIQGGNKLGQLAAATRAKGSSVLAGADAFLLYDTFGLPLDLQKLLAEPEGLVIDEEGYRAEMAGQRRRSREGSKISDSIFDEGPLASVSRKLPETEFVRGTLEIETEILAVVDDEQDDASERVIVVLARTPFYAEGGGQVGDSGTIEGQDFRIDVDDTVSVRGITLHRGVVGEGRPTEGPARAVVNRRAREATARHHTVTHLLHAALRTVLGEECTQAGSLVEPDRLRFDFRFPRALTADELREVETLVNAWVLANEPVGTEEMRREEAREAGAIALFGEKYGDRVRVVRVDSPATHGPSVELCGGTHVLRSGDIGSFRILSEGSIAAGVRRVEAQAGLALVDTMRRESEQLQTVAALYKTSPAEVPERIEATLAENKRLRKELDALRSEGAARVLADAVVDWQGLRVVKAVLPSSPGKVLREQVSGLVRDGCDLALVIAVDGDRAAYFVATGEAARERGLRADALCRALGERLGGKGGGKPAFAQGQGRADGDLRAALDGVLDEGLAPAG